MLGSILGFVTTFLTQMPKVVSSVEKIAMILKPKATGEQKHEAAVSLSTDVIMQIEGFSGKDIIDEKRFATGLDKVISGVVDMMHAVGILKSKN